MGLFEKIERIKEQPEHIRLRYVWFFVLVSMFFIITLWIFSLQADSVQKTENMGQIVDLNSLGKEIQQQKNTFQDAVKSAQDNSSGAADAIGKKQSDKAMEGSGSGNLPDMSSAVGGTKSSSFPVE